MKLISRDNRLYFSWPVYPHIKTDDYMSVNARFNTNRILKWARAPRIVALYKSGFIFELNGILNENNI
jgi:hypothetical protein